MSLSLQSREIVVTGRWLRRARLRHEWFDFLPSPTCVAADLRTRGFAADVFTFVGEIGAPPLETPRTKMDVGLAVLPLTTHEEWWTNLGFKARNKVRKAQKSGVELRVCQLDEAFADGIAAIYAENPVKQGRKFVHYGQKTADIKAELSSFAEQSVLVGAYCGAELVGFMKLFVGDRVIRTIHIIGSSRHREKNVMDALIAKAVEIGCGRGCKYLHYGSWTDGGVGTFREKHGFIQLVATRYFVPLSARGHMMLALQLHRPLRDRVPKALLPSLLDLRARWNGLRYGGEKLAAPVCPQNH